jgi:hypothetical protein
VVAKVRDRLAEKKQRKKLSIERFSLKKINEVEGKEQYRFKILNRFAAWKNLDDDDIDRAGKLLERI